MSIKNALVGIAAASMLAFNSFAPPMGGAYRPAFVDRAPEYDGLGRKKRIVPVAPTSKRKQSRAWRDYAKRVEATHSDREDPRADKYLHSHARQIRASRRLLAA